MAPLPILTSENPVLRQRARKLRSVSPAVQQLIDDMIETMRQAPGVGLAAPQVGASQRVIVVEYAENQADDETPPRLYVVVNPEIVRHSTGQVPGTEGCLSIPGYLGEVDRYQSVTLRGLDRRGRPLRLKANDWLARIFQHEIDHLDGVLFIDRASRVWKPEPDEAVAVQAIAPRPASRPEGGRASHPEGGRASHPEGGRASHPEGGRASHPEGDTPKGVAAGSHSPATSKETRP
jgi:peptide deformylase